METNIFYYILFSTSIFFIQSKKNQNRFYDECIDDFLSVVLGKKSIVIFFTL